MGANALRHFVRVQAIVTGKDATSSPIFTADFQPHHITQMIDAANTFFDDAGIELVFDPARNIARVHDSILNSSVSKGDFRIARVKRHLTKLVIFFTDEKDGGMSSSADDAWVLMPKQPDSGAFLAHELGHYFHLSHTFPEPQVADIADAAQRIKQFVETTAPIFISFTLPFSFGFDQAVISNALSIFDADAPTITDTPPDLGAAMYLTFEKACDPNPDFVRKFIPVFFSSGQVQLYDFNPNRLNLMSYFFACPLPGRSFSPQQNVRMRNALETGNRRHLTMIQDNWRYCKKCQGLFFGGLSASAPCVMVGQHDSAGSFNYTLLCNSDEGRGQSGWRFCKRCLGLFFPGVTNGQCAKLGPHDGSGSADYTLLANSDAFGQKGWLFCSACHSLFFGRKVGKTKCPFNGMPHNGANSFDYTLVSN